MTHRFYNGQVSVPVNWPDIPMHAKGYGLCPDHRICSAVVQYHTSEHYPSYPVRPRGFEAVCAFSKPLGLCPTSQIIPAAGRNVRVFDNDYLVEVWFKYQAWDDVWPFIVLMGINDAWVQAYMPQPHTKLPAIWSFPIP